MRLNAFVPGTLANRFFFLATFLGIFNSPFTEFHMIFLLYDPFQTFIIVQNTNVLKDQAQYLE